MNAALRLLQKIILQRNLIPASGKNTLFLHAQHADLLNRPEYVEYWQPWKTCATELPGSVLKNIPERPFYDQVYILLPRNVTEAQYLVALACKTLKENGILIAAAENNANGKRLNGLIEMLGLKSEIFSGNKSRCHITFKSSSLNNDVVEEWIKGGQIQKNDHDFWSVPGLFSWDRIDPGSALLLEHLPQKMAGEVADFGCGYGFLSTRVLQQHFEIHSLTMIDADMRALDCCTKNIQNLNVSVSTHPIWEDLSGPYLAHQPFDVIVMNPPFHEGKKAIASIGQNFISNAARNLKPHGQLFMVANRQLPYEACLAQHFSKYEMLQQQNGFKVFKAAR